MLFHRYKWSAAVVLFALPWVLFAAAANDFPTVRYRATVSEVRITFFASDENNRPVNKIEKDDFAVVDSGMVVRDFRSLLPADETALDVVAVVDASQSVAPRLQATVHDVLQLVSQRQLAADDNVSVMAFSGLQPVLICARNCRSAAAGQRLLAVKAAGATPLFDALAYGADFISRRRTPGVRPVLILFSDGDDTISKTSACDALEAVIASGALLYTIDLNKPAETQGNDLALGMGLGAEAHRGAGEQPAAPHRRYAGNAIPGLETNRFLLRLVVFLLGVDRPDVALVRHPGDDVVQRAVMAVSMEWSWLLYL